MEEMACASSWVTHLQEFKSSQSIKAFRAGRLVRTVETSVFVTFEGIGAGRHYTESSDGIPRFSFYHPPSVSTSREVSVTKTYWNPISTPPIDWCLKDRRQPACHLRVGGISCDKFYMKYLRELFDGIQIGNRHNTALNMNPEVCTGASPYGEAVCNVVAGNEVVLIFWPSPVSSMDVCRTDDGGCRLTTHNSHNQSRVLITTAITFKGQDLYFRSEIINGTTRIAKEDWDKPSVMTGLWTFTSPTIYLAHQAVSYSCEKASLSVYILIVETLDLQCAYNLFPSQQQTWQLLIFIHCVVRNYYF
jgi:hypothetical protein